MEGKKKKSLREWIERFPNEKAEVVDDEKVVYRGEPSGIPEKYLGRLVELVLSCGVENDGTIYLLADERMRHWMFLFEENEDVAVHVGGKQAWEGKAKDMPEEYMGMKYGHATWPVLLQGPINIYLEESDGR